MDRQDSVTAEEKEAYSQLSKKLKAAIGKKKEEGESPTSQLSSGEQGNSSSRERAASKDPVLVRGKGGFTENVDIREDIVPEGIDVDGLDSDDEESSLLPPKRRDGPEEEVIKDVEEKHDEEKGEEKQEEGKDKIKKKGRKHFKPIQLSIGIAVFLIISFVPFWTDKPETRRGLAVFLFAAILWATEAIPIWVTALCIPCLSVYLQISMDNANYFPASCYESNCLSTCGIDNTIEKAGVELLASLADSNVILILGGFTIARALNKYELDNRLAVWILSKASHKPPVFMFVFMALGYFLSMWVSNVAAPVLLVFLVLPILQEIDRETKFPQTVLLGIAIACNIGGMTTPIASPQNAAALTALSSSISESCTISFFQWMAVSMPLTVLFLVFSWAFLYFVYFRPMLRELPVLNLKKHEKMTWKHIYVIVVTVITICLWCTTTLTAKYVGNIGLLSLLPVIFLYAPGVLHKEDLREIDWHILLLLGGGTALGKVVKASGLLAEVAGMLQQLLQNASLWAVLAVFNLFIIVVTNFISHTVGAITILPIVAEVAFDLNDTPPLVVLCGVIACSGASMLPVSSFPNIICYASTDKHHKSYLRAPDYIKSGAILEVFIYLLTSTMGWAIASAVFGTQCLNGGE